MGFLQSIPNNLLIDSKLAWTKVFHFILACLLVSLFFLHGLFDEFLSCSVFAFTTKLQPNRVNSPVLEIFSKVMDTHVIHDMKTTCAVEVENTTKDTRMPAIERKSCNNGLVTSLSMLHHTIIIDMIKIK